MRINDSVASQQAGKVFFSNINVEASTKLRRGINEKLFSSFEQFVYFLILIPSDNAGKRSECRILHSSSLSTGVMIMAIWSATN